MSTESWECRGSVAECRGVSRLRYCIPGYILRARLLCHSHVPAICTTAPPVTRLHHWEALHTTCQHNGHCIALMRVASTWHVHRLLSRIHVSSSFDLLLPRRYVSRSALPLARSQRVRRSTVVVCGPLPRTGTRSIAFVCASAQVKRLSLRMRTAAACLRLCLQHACQSLVDQPMSTQ